MPQRRPTKAFEPKLGGDPALEWEYYLAERLHMTVHDLRRRMGNDEFIRWQVYYGRKAQKQQQAQWGAAR